jgi:hypothetical protein
MASTVVTDRCCYPFNASFDAHYRSLILHILPALMHHVVANAFKGAINLKLLHPGQQLEFKLQDCQVGEKKNTNSLSFKQ